MLRLLTLLVLPLLVSTDCSLAETSENSGFREEVTDGNFQCPVGTFPIGSPESPIGCIGPRGIGYDYPVPGVEITVPSPRRYTEHLPEFEIKLTVFVQNGKIVVIGPLGRRWEYPLRWSVSICAWYYIHRGDLIILTPEGQLGVTPYGSDISFPLNDPSDGSGKLLKREISDRLERGSCFVED